MNTRDLSREEARTLPSTSEHYMAFVGPPDQYDFMGATQFSLLCHLGLRSHHRLLDFGCGSLRAGRFFVLYLNPGNYVGIDPNDWLIKDAVEREIGSDLVEMKKPVLIRSDDAATAPGPFDFILAQSIFSHAGPDLTRRALHAFAHVLAPRGLCAVTFIHGEEDPPDGWWYGGVTSRTKVRYRESHIRELVEDAGLHGCPIPWHHPRQTWWLLGRSLPDVDGLVGYKP
jgi:SAM-dependent methyltransferase